MCVSSQQHLRAATIAAIARRTPSQVAVQNATPKVDERYFSGSWTATLRILSGEVSQVVKGLRRSITKRSFNGAKRKTLQGVADYLYQNRTRMRHHQYLANGWPTSGPVEGACKNFWGVVPK